MKPPGTLCQRLGIRQHHMAQYLGVSPQLMALYETDRRNLPADARKKLLQLELLLQQQNGKPKKASPLPHTKKDAEKTRQLLQLHAAGCALKAARADHKLRSIQAKHEQAQLLLQLLAQLDAQLPEDDPDKLWISIMRKTALKKIEQNGLPAQTKVRLRINSFRQQETAAKMMLAEV